MWRNPEMENFIKGESKGANRLDSEHLPMALREEAEQLMDLWKPLIPIVEDCISKVGINFVQQVIGPIMDDSIRKVKAEIQLAVEKVLVYQNRNSVAETTTPIARDYKLKFLDKVSCPVYTGREIKGKEGTDIKVALVDNVTEDPVDSGPESSAKVEILFLDAGVEDFNNSIINNPHFRKPIYVDLAKGIGILSRNVKLGHISGWMKLCKCRLGARVVQKFDGSRIKEASTESFTVLDKRSSLYKKYDQPLLSDEVWRLKNIGKNGHRRTRLRDNNISTVEEFLRLLYDDPERLRKIFGRGKEAWKITVDQALKCYSDDTKKYSQYSSSSECKNGEVFDVGQQKRVLPDDSCVPIESVAEAEKDDESKSLSPPFENQNEAPAFEKWNNMASFDCEASRNFPCTSNDKNAANSNGLNGHLDEYFDNLNDVAYFNKEASFLRDFPCTSNDKNAANSTGLDGDLSQYFENAEISNEPPFGFPDNVPNLFFDPLPLWNFDDDRELSL